MDMQNVSSLQIPEGVVRAIHDKDNRLLWGRVAYNTKYVGSTVQNGAPTPDAPIPVQTVTGEQTVEVNGDGVSQDYEINLGKNLFDKDNPNLFIGYFDGGVQDPSLIYASGNRNRVLWLGCKPNTTYSFSFENLDSFNPPQVGTTSELPADGIAVSKLGNFSSGSMKLENVTTTSDARYLVIRFQTSAGSININGVLPSALDGLQIEVSSTATPYAPYFTPIELCKIGDYQDYIYKDGDDWYAHKECNKYIFSGSEGWSSGASEAASGYYGYYINTQDFLSEYQKGGTDTPVYMSKFAQIPYGYNTQQNGAMTNYSAPYLTVVSINLSTVSALKTSLAGSAYYYALATPTDTQIIDGALISQLNAIHEWITRYGYNSTVTGNLPIIISKTNL